ncbi:ABC transporter ATP-binding protein [Brotonthovivens ammoniilytica]|uniref:ABC transporter ATP-binding protein n=1 Tax=Brotonthovivens ammoniilytica TaxID=2981725 RepID=A0ABT2TNH4_9FIRM|nr:ABC transporter ATP-binding protein [Brotonthovivens ammoniilytica]MCU6763004.1 ABC transporter ATP-binding protein [Brotonthovivens ammoniilytica]
MITVEHLTKCYGDFTAVDALSFEIEEGHVYGFLGPNGAGKSTTMNIMTGCLSATAGHIKIDGFDIFEEAAKAKRLIGYLPEQPPLYMNESPVEYLKFVGEAKGFRGAELTEQIQEVIRQTRIEEVKNKRISDLSKGYRQRVGIAQALLGRPKVIILDEPTVGLDPIQIIEIRDLIKELGKKHTVIFSSHILSEVQTICDQILIISKGKLIAFDEPKHLEKSLLSPGEITITADASPEEVEKILDSLEHMTEFKIQESEREYTVFQVKTDQKDVYDTARRIFFLFAEQKKALLEMTLKKANLEDIFLELTENGSGQTETQNGGEDLPDIAENESCQSDTKESGVDQL